MELNKFKDILFDLINESDMLSIREIESRDEDNLFRLILNDGTVFSLVCANDTP